MNALAIVATRVFDGARLREDTAVMIANGRVLDVVAADAVPSGTPVRQAAGTLAPGFIDVQVNGGGGVLFNETPTVEGIRAIGSAHRKFGTTGFLPTLITDTREKMAAAVEAVRERPRGGCARPPRCSLGGPFPQPGAEGRP